jgi:hypothetical protein
MPGPGRLAPKPLSRKGYLAIKYHFERRCANAPCPVGSAQAEGRSGREAGAALPRYRERLRLRIFGLGFGRSHGCSVTTVSSVPSAHHKRIRCCQRPDLGHLGGVVM